MFKSSSFFFLFLLLVLLIAGCSSTKSSPMLPENPQMDNNLPATELNTDESQHNILGTGTVTFDVESLSASIEPDRTPDWHINVTGKIPYPTFVMNSWDPVEEIINVTVKLENSTQWGVFDVRMIIYTDDDGHLLLNEDNWTSLFDIPGGETINPFKAYCTSHSSRLFPAYSESTEDLEILLPDGNTSVRYIIDACYPYRCEEPFWIYDFYHGLIFDQQSSMTDVSVFVEAWDDDVNSVTLECPAITALPEINLNDAGRDKWIGEIINTNNVDVGEYPALIKARTAGSGTLALYHPVSIRVLSIENGWAVAWGGAALDRLTASALDNSGNSYIAGIVSQQADLDPGPGILEPDRDNETFLMKLNSQGALVWANTYNFYINPACAWIYSICISDNNELYIAGGFLESIDFDPGPGSDVLTSISTGMSDFYISKYDTDGNYLWTIGWGDEDCDSLTDICIDRNGFLICVGDKDFPPHWWPRAPYACKIDQNGNMIWEFSLEPADYTQFYSVALDSTSETGSLYTTGRFKNTYDFDPGANTNELTSNGDVDIFIAEYDQNGEFIWATSFGGSDYDIGYDIDVNNNTLCIAGAFSSMEIDFDPGPGFDVYYNHTASFLGDAFISCFNTSGDYLWAKAWGGTGFDSCESIVADISGNINVIGRFNDVVDFDPGNGTDIHESYYNSNDLFVSSYDNDGNYRWTRSWESHTIQDNNYICTDMSGNLFLSGVYGRMMDFDPGDAIYEIDHRQGDAFLMKLLPNGYWE